MTACVQPPFQLQLSAKVGGYSKAAGLSRAGVGTSATSAGFQRCVGMNFNIIMLFQQHESRVESPVHSFILLILLELRPGLALVGSSEKAPAPKG